MAKVINKSQLIKDLALELNYSQKETKRILDTLTNYIKNKVLYEDTDVRIVNFGKFEKRTTKSWITTNPLNSMVSEVPAREKIGYKASKKVIIKK